MEKPFYALLGLATAAALVVGPVRPAEAATAEQWHQLADKAAGEVATVVQVLDRAGAGKEVLPRDLPEVTDYAAWRWGWQDARTQAWLNRIRSNVNPDGGYGINAPWDWGNNGSVNPATTSYTITTAAHVGVIYLRAYDAGAIPASWLTEASRSVLDTPRTTWSNDCVSYSNNPPDAGVACVWNINAFGAWFLWEVWKRDLIPSGRAQEAIDKAVRWRNLTRGHFNRTYHGWPYDHRDTARAIQDPWHNMATVEPMSLFDPTIKPEAAGGQKQVWPGHDVNLALLKPGLDYLTCSEAENNYTSVNARANSPYSKQIDRLHSRKVALGFAMLVIRRCHP